MTLGTVAVFEWWSPLSLLTPASEPLHSGGRKGAQEVAECGLTKRRR